MTRFNAAMFLLSTLRLTGAFAPVTPIGRRSLSLLAGDGDFDEFSSKVRARSAWLEMWASRETLTPCKS